MLAALKNAGFADAIIAATSAEIRTCNSIYDVDAVLIFAGERW